MALTVRELIAKLAELPEGWHAYATKAGSSIEVWDPDGDQYGWIFTDERPARLLTDTRRRRPTIGTNTEGGERNGT